MNMLVVDPSKGHLGQQNKVTGAKKVVSDGLLETVS